MMIKKHSKIKILLFKYNYEHIHYYTLFKF